MEFLIPLLYAVLLCCLIYSWRFFNDAALPRILFIGIFLIKVFCGILYIEIMPGGDAVAYFNDALNNIYPAVWQFPFKYLYLTLGPNGGNIPDFILPEVMAMGYWGDTSDYMVVRFNALCLLLSFENFHAHAVFMSFLSLIGLVWIYRSFRHVSSNSVALVVSVFLLPSVLFWTSAVHKEGLLIFSIGMMFYGCQKLMDKFEIKSILQALIGALLVFAVRDFIFLMLLPGMIAFFISARKPAKYLWSFPVMIAVMLTAGSLTPIFGNKNIPEMIAFKQSQFKSLEAGNTQIDAPDFEPRFSDLFIHLPAALKNSLLGPFFIKPVGFIHYVIIIENALLLIALACFPILFGRPTATPLTLWGFIFSILLLILIGYIVPNVGAIARYRSIALPFFFLFFSTGKKPDK